MTMFSSFFSRKSPSGRSAGHRRRSNLFSPEPLEDRRLLSAGGLFHGMPFGYAAWLGPFAMAHRNAPAIGISNASVSSAQTTATTATSTSTSVAASWATSPANPTYGEQVALTATVTGGATRGKVEFYDAGVAIGSAWLDSSGLATLNVNDLAVGDHSITATYLGNTDFSTSTSDTSADLTVDAASTYTLLATSGNPAAPGDPLTLTARITGAPTTNTATNSDDDGGGGCGGHFGFGSQAALPTGTVDFQATDVNNPDASPIDLGSAKVVNGVATLPVSTDTGTSGPGSLAPGDYTITAVYTPASTETNYTGSTSASVAQSVSSTLAATRTRVTMSPSYGLSAGDAVTYTVTVKAKNSSSTSATPTGTVTFVDAVTGLPLTGTDSSNPNPVTLVDGTAAFATTYTTDPIIVTYTPDTSTGTGSDTYASSQVILPLFGREGRGFGHWGRDSGEGDFGCNPQDMAVQNFMANFRGFDHFWR
jgi:large repetitive protein